MEQGQLLRQTTFAQREIGAADLNLQPIEAVCSFWGWHTSKTLLLVCLCTIRFQVRERRSALLNTHGAEHASKALTRGTDLKNSHLLVGCKVASATPFSH